LSESPSGNSSGPIRRASQADSGDRRRFAPATARNRGPLLEVLRGVLPEEGLVLEVAAGTGEHAAHFAAALPGLTWQPTDLDEDARASINAWAQESSLENIRPALPLDARIWPWPVSAAAAILCVNMIHIAPWAATSGLLRGARELLPPGTPLILYGPFLRAGEPTAPSNLAFDADLRRHDPEWGVRPLEKVALAAEGFALERVVEMPAHNLTVIFRRL
jgi:SAM-dependent methyltransferase